MEARKDSKKVAISAEICLSFVEDRTGLLQEGERGSSGFGLYERTLTSSKILPRARMI